jgi:STE24 endopeptidase
MKEIIIAIIITIYLFELIVQIINYRYRNHALPENVKDIYPKEAYQKWLNYTMNLFVFKMIEQAFQTTFLIVLLMTPFFPWLASIFKFSSPIMHTFLFIGSFFLLQFIIQIPFQYYHTFVIEEKFGFNKTTKALFMKDRLKELILILGFGALIIWLLHSLYLYFSYQLVLFIGIAFLVIVLILVLIFLFNPLLVRIFNRLIVLEEGELKDKIHALSTNLQFNIKKIFRMDASKRSSKVNAFFNGIGKTKEVVLYDTLIEKCTTDEIIAVLAHELGHAYYKDTVKLLFQQFFLIGTVICLWGWMMSNPIFSTAFGLGNVHFGFILILLTVLLEPILFLFRIPFNYLSRKAEYRADKFAALQTNKKVLQEAFKKITLENFSNLNPHPLFVFLTYTHPTVSQRLSALDNISNLV